MDSSFVIKPPPAARPVRDTLPVREAVATDLGSEQTVTSRHGHPGKDNRENPRDSHARKDRDAHAEHAPQTLVEDAASRDVILRERDVRSIDRDKYDQALHRNRAYYRLAHAGPDAASASDPHADIKA